MSAPILITGGLGLVGTGLTHALARLSDIVQLLDLRAPAGSSLGDVRDKEDVLRAVSGCRGVVHLAAVSRVIWGERDPALCMATNVGGTRNVLEAAIASPNRPWVLLASSREVYGEPDHLPVNEDTPLRPMNVYGHSKAEAERAVIEVGAAGHLAAIVRLSNVYGSTADHGDRVLPAFARAAALGLPLRVDGAGHTFDFTHLDDTVAGLVAIIRLLDSGMRVPPLHLLTGVPTTLAEAAGLAVRLAGSGSRVVPGAQREYDVARFVGDPSRAKTVLGWSSRISLEAGLARLVSDFQNSLEARPVGKVVLP
ncbi:MAG: NAD-dependent epimerase/dehydratase family protein [Myxococcota bacterium]